MENRCWIIDGLIEILERSILAHILNCGRIVEVKWILNLGI